MPSQLSKGTTFSNGNTYEDTDFNNLVDSATILPGAISEQTQAAPVDADLFLYRQNASSLLKSCSLTQIINGFPANAAAATASLRSLGTTSTKAAAGNDTRFPQFQNGVRMGNGDGSADTIATPNDVAFGVTDLTGAPTEIDWAVGNVFIDDMTHSKTYTWANRHAGRTIVIIFKLNGHTATLPAGTAVASVGTGTTFWYVQITYTSLGTIGHGMLI